MTDRRGGERVGWGRVGTTLFTRGGVTLFTEGGGGVQLDLPLNESLYSIETRLDRFIKC